MDFPQAYHLPAEHPLVYHLEEIVFKKIIDAAETEIIGQFDVWLEQMEAAIPDGKVKKYFDAMEKLHMKFFEAAHNAVMLDLYESLMKRLAPFRYMSLSFPNSLQHSLREYKDIVAGLKAKDYASVVNRWRQKQKRALDALEKVIVRQEQQPGPLKPNLFK
ncbi:FCD domain-containing protein [Effusibacillus dendaii]|uniref:GntR C-terminal domain-containing protein n=1 Tax=Effusibacillus dendaii TaxID=2743772 RepID=A0A7I8D8R9_9BACL|nr:FCD domain-containing protein [Effusibacillus dendaii]BCJ86397.1 hypothetical protein skT53_13820 [Effusibacillus dendaii]